MEMDQYRQLIGEKIDMMIFLIRGYLKLESLSLEVDLAEEKFWSTKISKIETLKGKGDISNFLNMCFIIARI